MKMIFLVFSAAIEIEVMDSLCKIGIEQYTKLPSILGVGEESEPHLDDVIWPGTNHGLLIAVDDVKKNKLLSEVKRLHKDYGKEGIRVFVMPLEEVV